MSAGVPLYGCSPTLMRCLECGRENRAGIRFCEECGAGLEQVCPSCRAAVPLDRRFCGNCGWALSPASPPPTSSVAPQAYTPKHLAEKILTSRSAIEGERKHVTVLFADLRGSLEMVSNRDPEDARKLLDPILERMMQAVHRYEGTVNQVLGDGIMALFGAPLAHEDHAVRACHAALEMQGGARELAEQLRSTLGAEIKIRVGMNSGEVVVRSIGSDLRMDYTAVGLTTHLAGRMEQMARPGTTLLTSATARLAGSFVQVRSLGVQDVKGMTVPMEVYELVGGGPLRTRLQASRARALTRFVGRAPELGELQRAAERALKFSISLTDVLAMVREFRDKDKTTPVVLMGYLNPVEVMGYPRFAEKAAAAGVDGVLTVDLPPEEAHEFQPAMRAQGLDTIFLLAPTSPAERIKLIAKAASGFIYYVSLRGVTGAANLDVREVAAKLKEIRTYTKLPLGVGFGIGSPEAAAQVAEFADAVIVGSAVVKRMEEMAAKPDKILTEVPAFIDRLREAMDQAAQAPTTATGARR